MLPLISSLTYIYDKAALELSGTFTGSLETETITSTVGAAATMSRKKKMNVAEISPWEELKLLT